MLLLGVAPPALLGVGAGAEGEGEAEGVPLGRGEVVRLGTPALAVAAAGPRLPVAPAAPLGEASLEALAAPDPLPARVAEALAVWHAEGLWLPVAVTVALGETLGEALDEAKVALAPKEALVEAVTHSVVDCDGEGVTQGVAEALGQALCVPLAVPEARFEAVTVGEGLPVPLLPPLEEALCVVEMV
jgi:hypothetical protein